MSVSSSVMANSIRALAMDAVQKANSGHPGMPMGMAEIAVALWHDHLRHAPNTPQWLNRDRFVLSNGHGSMLLYALLHLTGYDLSIDDIKKFRQLHSKTPGHPEVGITPGVETTTGPLGQGIANAVGMALAEKLLATQFNQPGFDIIDHYTYVFLGDGCLMEGISHEVCSLAGTLKLNKLIVLYDDNQISIDGRVEPWFADHTPQRFVAYGWDVIENVNGHDVDAVSQAIAKAKTNLKPTLICCKTLIGKGAPGLEGGDKVHGSPLGDAAIAATRAAIGWAHAPFEIPQEVYAAWNNQAKGQGLVDAWQALFERYQNAHPALAAEFIRRTSKSLPENFAEIEQLLIDQVIQKAETIATRKASQNALEVICKHLPEMLGGSADLTSSNLTNWSGSVAVRAQSSDKPFVAGNHINYGVREFGMSAIMNGIALYGGFIPYGGTFLTFSDYSRNALRMAALMKIRSLFVFTHDSIGLGEDGPTHQSIEHVSSLRLIPHLDVWRPADTTESAIAWTASIARADGPSTLIFSRQNLAFIKRDTQTVQNIRKGGYVLRDCASPQVILIATGSEVDLALKAADQLVSDNIATRVVSMPSTNVFDRQDKAYQNMVLPANIPCVAIEAGVSAFWHKYIGRDGVVVAIDTFGESAPANVLFEHFGLTVNHVVTQAKSLLK